MKKGIHPQVLGSVGNQEKNCIISFHLSVFMDDHQEYFNDIMNPLIYLYLTHLQFKQVFPYRLVEVLFYTNF
jgi:hypothetical protein